ncbi:MULTISPECIES: exopolysaccharide production repressor protein [Mesorhizobium]|nr:MULTISPECIES: exopolysaccharide production repressor protein [unclassified Mesorhizobium]AZO32597.1 exopolysaccharide production repressor exox [Mesorhizobium sp. M1B.F.Ca.ET.045.04.1.1]RWA68710.1 MAG: exopolysaccharide production repressor exox [Mesorhizobium sp.]RWA83819.1 MAG: exopolysaccharide production repressor exox [Mesorhizobium sp.]RWB23275.1 MAG: exopolysaccharide production repressor exox [Mesorhizobium sp.]RWE03944.1 MAG: exopolysaccharide production repressor exox [Mesorhizobi
MSLPKFIVGMIFALAIVVGWSYFDGASLGTIIMRTVICAVVIQVGYFLLVYAMIARSGPVPADKSREADRGIKVAEGEKLSARRGSLR